MDKFLQIHLLTSYPPSNLNRDDLGRPKTALMGGATRLRISSQSLKRAWRTSELFEDALKEHIGTRTKEIGVKIYKKFNEQGVSHKNSMDWAGKIAGVFGKTKKPLTQAEKKKLKDDKDLTPEKRLKKELTEVEIEQLAHFGPEEEKAIWALVDAIIARGEGPEKEELSLLRAKSGAADIALFGRMLASHPSFNMEAAAQIAHAITVNKVAVEDDFFTAVDDLNNGEEDMGAGHMGETEFGSGVFYIYICIDRHLLLDNLNGDQELANKTIAALLECAAKVAPTGKQNSFASRAHASFMACETGNQQPRSLSVAFLEPVSEKGKEKNMLTVAIELLEQTRSNMDKVYGACSNNFCAMNAHSGEGSLQAVIQCATE
ncbi:MAG: type I-E CRISPR-associated protein Cas7/Cse4/CasC [Candidatus Electrothrix sp. ATG1]|nr:type I-E CRISPR-associated protein Cas7/Cse4/CasC [Candidatus Electrothrix sp. ATG1]